MANARTAAELALRPTQAHSALPYPARRWPLLGLLLAHKRQTKPGAHDVSSLVLLRKQ